MGQAALVNFRIDDASTYLGRHARIRTEEPLFRRAVECATLGVAITQQLSGDMPPTLLFRNAALSAMAGDPMAEPFRQAIEESHRGDEAHTAEIEHRDPEGNRLVVRFRSDPLRDASGQVTHRMATFRDATAEANLEEAIRRNERLACIGLLAAGIAHEINNPTGSALLAAETALELNDSPDGREAVNTCLRNIVASMDRCGRIVRTLLRYTQQQPTERQACNINDVADQSLELARPYAQSHGAELRLELDRNVPLAPMNPLEIELVLVNAIRNAVEAGEGRVTITVRTARTPDGVRVEVSDTGHGMTEEQLAHVFDPLYTTRRCSGGSGLGMSIALGIVRQHDGSMEVQSQPGRGTTVTIDLPIGIRHTPYAANIAPSNLHRIPASTQAACRLQPAEVILS